MAANQPETKPVPGASLLMTLTTLVCAFTAPVVLYVKGMDSLLNSPSTAAWVLLPTALGILGLGVGLANLRKPAGRVARTFALFATVMAVVVPGITALIVLFLAWVNGPGGG